MEKGSSFRKAKPTKRSAKIILASALGFSLLLGGSTYALWSATGTAATSTTISTGDLKVTAASVQKWSDITVPAAPVSITDLSSYRLVPGHTIKLKQDLNVIVVGNNISGKLQVTVPNNTLSAPLMDQAVFTLNLLDSTGAVVSTVTPAANTANSLALNVTNLKQTAPAGQLYTVEVLVKLPSTADNTTKTQTANLDNMAITLTQGPAYVEPYPAANPVAQFGITAVGGKATVNSYSGPAGAVVIPESYTVGGVTSPVTAIAASAFKGKNITSIVMPDTITTIGDYAFQSNPITSLKLSKNLTSVNNSLLSNGTGVIDTLIIPDKVVSIGNSAFSQTKITHLILGKSVETIGAAAFAASGIQTLNLPDGLTTLGGQTFYANQLTSVILPDSLTTLSNSTFENNNIASLVLGKGLTTIPAGAFNSNKLTSVTIPEGVTSIGNNAFWNNLLISVTIPATVTSVGNSALGNNPLTSVYMAGNAPTTVAAGSTGSFGLTSGKTIYRHAAATGYSNPWMGYVTALY